MSMTPKTPKLRFPEFSGEWEEKRLGDISSIKTGNKDTQNKIDNGQYPFFVRSNTIERINTYSFDGEAILTAGDGVGVGKVFHYINGKFDYHQRVYNIHNFTNKACGKYVYCYFSDRFFNRVSKLSAKNSVDSVRMDMISEMKIPLPKVREQQKIADFLTAVDARIEALSRQQELTEQYKKGMMQKIFSQEMRFRADDGSEFPEWEEKNGNLIFETVTNKEHNSDLPILAITQEHGAIPREMIDYQISVTDKSIETYKVVEIGDFIISLRSFQGGIEYSRYKGICSPAYIILRPSIQVNEHFFRHYFKTEQYIKLLNKNIEGIRDGKMVSYKQFSEIPLPLPSIAEQTKIADFLSSIDNKLEALSSELQAAKKFKKALLQQMFV